MIKSPMINDERSGKFVERRLAAITCTHFYLFPADALTINSSHRRKLKTKKKKKTLDPARVMAVLFLSFVLRSFGKINLFRAE